MNDNILLKEIHTETLMFFNNILDSIELQEEYDLINYVNRDFVLNTIKDFKNNPNAYLVKPFYEKTYLDATVPRSIFVRRDEYGFITTKLNSPNSEPSIIEPFRFVSIIKQLIEDETIKKEMYAEKETEKENDMSL